MVPSTARRVPAFSIALFCIAFIGLSALVATPAFGQSTGGRILGRVADPTGAVLTGVKVTLINEATGVSRDTPDQ